MSKELYIISRKRIICLEDAKRLWDYNFKNLADREECLDHLKEHKARISMAR